MKADLLLKLADFLEALPPERFNYRHWVGIDWRGAVDLSCGTTACALGWATTMPEFRELGLRLEKSVAWNGGSVTLDIVGGESLKGSMAAAAVFEISTFHAEYLFFPGTVGEGGWPNAPYSSATAKDVADHLRQFVKRMSA